MCVGIGPLMADNSLGLDFEKESAPEETTTEQEEPKPEKKKPYVNPERVKTGGTQRVGVTVIVYGAQLTTARRRSSPMRRSLS